MRSVCNSERHASELPNTARNEEIDCVATIGMQRHCRVSAKDFFIARWVVLAHRSEGLIFVTDKNGGPEVAARIRLHLGRAHEEALVAKRS